MEKKEYVKLIFGLSFIVFGLVFNYAKISMNSDLGFGTLGNWFMFIGLVSIFITVLAKFSKKKKIIDERIILISSKANRIVFLSMVIFAFLTLVIDQIKPIKVSLGIFMSYFLCMMLVVYLISYKIIEKYY